MKKVAVNTIFRSYDSTFMSKLCGRLFFIHKLTWEYGWNSHALLKVNAQLLPFFVYRRCVRMRNICHGVYLL